MLAAALLVGSRSPGRGRLLRRGWLWAGAAVVAVCAAPYLVWQALNGWPQLDMAGSIAGGDAQGGRLGFIPFQLLLVSPVLAPVWIAGLVRLLRAGPGRPFRFLGVGYLVLRGCVYLIAGGKAYYLAGMYPALLAAGAIATDGWLRDLRGRPAARRALALSLVVGAIVGLAVLPARALPPGAGGRTRTPASRSPGRAYVDQIAAVWNRLPGSQRATGVVLTQNYGEAGAIDRFGPARGLPPAYSGHNGFADWAAAVRAGRAGRGRRATRTTPCAAGCSAPASSRRPWTTGSAWTPRSRACRSGSAGSRRGRGRETWEDVRHLG